jgi:hypothetical protein
MPANPDGMRLSESRLDGLHPTPFSDGLQDDGDRVLSPSWASVTDFPIIPGELFANLQTSFYYDPLDAVYKVMVSRRRNRLRKH